MKVAPQKLIDRRFLEKIGEDETIDRLELRNRSKFKVWEGSPTLNVEHLNLEREEEFDAGANYRRRFDRHAHGQRVDRSR